MLFDLVSQSNGLLIKPVLFSLLVDLGIPGKLNLLAEVIDCLDVVHDLLLTGTAALHQVLILLPCALHALLLLFADFAQVLELLLQVLQDFLLGKFNILKGLKFEARDLSA